MSKKIGDQETTFVHLWFLIFRKKLMVQLDSGAIQLLTLIERLEFSASLSHSQRMSREEMVRHPKTYKHDSYACSCVLFDVDMQWYCCWKKSCTSWYGESTIIYRVLYMSSGAGFLTSTVCVDIDGFSLLILIHFVIALWGFVTVDIMFDCGFMWLILFELFDLVSLDWVNLRFAAKKLDWSNLRHSLDESHKGWLIFGTRL